MESSATRDCSWTFPEEDNEKERKKKPGTKNSSPSHFFRNHTLSRSGDPQENRQVKLQSQRSESTPGKVKDKKVKRKSTKKLNHQEFLSRKSKSISSLNGYLEHDEATVKDPAQERRKEGHFDKFVERGLKVVHELKKRNISSESMERDMDELDDLVTIDEEKRAHRANTRSSSSPPVMDSLNLPAISSLSSSHSISFFETSELELSDVARETKSFDSSKSWAGFLSDGKHSEDVRSAKNKKNPGKKRDSVGKKGNLLNRKRPSLDTSMSKIRQKKIDKNLSDEVSFKQKSRKKKNKDYKPKKFEKRSNDSLDKSPREKGMSTKGVGYYEEELEKAQLIIREYEEREMKLLATIERLQMRLKEVQKEKRSKWPNIFVKRREESESSIPLSEDLEIFMIESGEVRGKKNIVLKKSSEGAFQLEIEEPENVEKLSERLLGECKKKEFDVHKIKELVAAGADVNFADNRGQTPLLCACKNNINYDVVEQLVKAGSNVKAIDNLNRFSVLHYLGGLKLDAAQLPEMSNILDLLVTHGLPIDYCLPESEITALHIAVLSGNTPLVELLLEKKADPTKTDKQGLGCLHMAVNLTHNELVAKFLDLGLSPNDDGYPQGTPLALATNLPFGQEKQKILGLMQDKCDSKEDRKERSTFTKTKSWRLRAMQGGGLIGKEKGCKISIHPSEEPEQTTNTKQEQCNNTNNEDPFVAEQAYRRASLPSLSLLCTGDLLPFAFGHKIVDEAERQKISEERLSKLKLVVFNETTTLIEKLEHQKKIVREIGEGRKEEKSTDNEQINQLVVPEVVFSIERKCDVFNSLLDTCNTENSKKEK